MRITLDRSNRTTLVTDTIAMFPELWAMLLQVEANPTPSEVFRSGEHLLANLNASLGVPSHLFNGVANFGSRG